MTGDQRVFFATVQTFSFLATVPAGTDLPLSFTQTPVGDNQGAILLEVEVFSRP